MLRKYPTFGSTISSVKYVKTKDIPTAATNGKIIYYNEDFMSGLTDDQQTFILSHEVCHIALSHIERGEGKDKRLWNIATDAVINKHLERDGLAMVDGVVNIDNALEYDAEELYEKLLKENEEKQKQNKDGNSEKGNEDNVGHDSHEMWGSGDELEGGDDNNEQDEQSNSNDTQEVNKGANDGQKSNKPTVSEKEQFEKNAEERTSRAQRIMDELKGQSGSFGGSEKLFKPGEVGVAKKAVTNWKRTLVRYLEIEDEVWGHRFSDSGNNYAARIEDIELEDMAETEIILDTSGSVSQELLKSFLRQVKLVLKTSKIKVGTFSNDFNGFVEIKNKDDIDNLQLHIGGGTNFDAASRAFSRGRNFNRICFTDGMDGGDAKIRDKRNDIVWVSFENKHFRPDKGRVIYVPENEIYLKRATKDDGMSR